MKPAIILLHLFFSAAIAHAIGEKNKVNIAQITYPGYIGNRHETALNRLLWEVGQRTSITPSLVPVVLKVSDPKLADYPLLYLGGEAAVTFTEADVDKLRGYLLAGATLLIDNYSAEPGGAFQESTENLIKALFPNQTLTPIAPEHVIFRSFYLLNQFVGRVAITPELTGLDHQGRLLIVYSNNDLAGAWARDPLGRWVFSAYPEGERQRELAFRWGINIVMYALCGDYKTDQVHIPFLLKRRKWKLQE